MQACASCGRDLLGHTVEENIACEERIIEEIRRNSALRRRQLQGGKHVAQ